MNAPQQKKLNIELGEKEAEGIYSNLVLIAHSASEFILDFARLLPAAPKAKVFSRIVMTPSNAKALLNLLDRNLKSYEEKHGKVKVSGETNDDTSIGFKPAP